MNSPIASAPEQGAPTLLDGAAESMLAGRIADARAAAEKAVSLDPANARAHHVLGVIDAAANRSGAAVARLEQALALDPNHETWWHNLGTTHAAARDWPASLNAFTRGAERYPNSAPMRLGLARALVESDRYEEAAATYDLARSLGCDKLAALIGIARALKALARYDEAVELLGTEAVAHPDSLKLQELLAELNALRRRADLVRYHREQAVRLRPNDALRLARLAAACWDNGDLDRALALSRAVIAKGAATPAFHSFYLSGLLHEARSTAASIREAHELWASTYCPTIPRRTDWTNDRNPDRRLRVGWFGGDFYDNPSLHFLLQFFLHHDSAAYEVVGYDVRCQNDAGTEAFRRASDRWVSCAGATDQELADLVAQDGVDVLIDTTGHFSGHRMLASARHPAPVQLVHPNYPSTTGLPCFDAILTDGWLCPPGAEAQYSEPVLRLPSGYLCYHPPSAAPAVTPLPALENDYVTFGLFQRPVKLNAGAWDRIGAILNSVPRSRLLVHNAFPELDVADSLMRNLYIRELAGRGVAAARIDFRGPADFADHLAILSTADLALDTFPYNGQTTTAECLWMGLPVVTLTGNYHVARVGRCILHRAGFPEWETFIAAGYVATAIALATDLDVLAETRRKLRPCIASSPLVDGRATVQESGMRFLWQKWCAQE
jgi:predicted O-linked N-acetylglucosamine transferase (SPINDLY family)